LDERTIFSKKSRLDNLTLDDDIKNAAATYYSASEIMNK